MEEWNFEACSSLFASFAAYVIIITSLSIICYPLLALSNIPGFLSFFAKIFPSIIYYPIVTAVKFAQLLFVRNPSVNKFHID